MRRHTVVVLARAIVGSALALSLTVAPARGAPPGAIDTAPCITFDTHGYRYIAFARTGVAETGIYLATNRSGTWRLSPHPVTPGDRCPAITVDSAGHVHLLATRPLPDDPNGNYDLYYATNKSGAWRASKVHYGEVGTASLAIDRTGRANIAITDEDGVFVIRRAASGGWLYRYATSGLVSHLGADPAGALWLLVADASHRRNVRLANRSGSWLVDRIPLRYSNSVTIDLAIDGSGRRYLVTYDPETGLATIYKDGPGGFSRVDRTAAHAQRLLTKSASEPSGELHMLFRYFRSTDSWGVVDQNRHGGRWQTQLVGYVGASGRADIDVDARGRVAAAFERDGVVWSYWNNWTGVPHRFRVSDLG